MENHKQPPVTKGPSDVSSLSIVGDTYRILVSGEETGNAFATIDMLVPPGGGPGPHAHPDFQESFYVVEGEVEVSSEVGVYTATKGSYIVIPKGGIVHGFKNKTNTVAHLLCVVVPSGLEQMFLEIGQPVEAGTFLPVPQLTEAALIKMKAIAEKYGQKVYPPDYLTK